MGRSLAPPVHENAIDFALAVDVEILQRSLSDSFRMTALGFASKPNLGHASLRTLSRFVRFRRMGDSRTESVTRRGGNESNWGCGDDSFAFLDGHELIGLDPGQGVFASARPEDLQTDSSGAARFV